MSDNTKFYIKFYNQMTLGSKKILILISFKSSSCETWRVILVSVS